MQHSRIAAIQDAIAPLRQQIIEHPVYPAITTLAELRVFMEHHVYAVWDFMSLLKALQDALTCTTLPWVPKGEPELRFLINEIVLGEESDVDARDQRKSHFEMYLQAMEQSAADTSGIQRLLDRVYKGDAVADAIDNADIPEAAKTFLHFTFQLIATDKPHVWAAVFTFGREDLIPGMFHSLVGDLNTRFPDALTDFKYYLDRHIEVDGDHHSHLALQMTASLCGDNEIYWQEALEASEAALRMRLLLWDAVQAEIQTAVNA